MGVEFSMAAQVRTDNQPYKILLPGSPLCSLRSYWGFVVWRTDANSKSFAIADSLPCTLKRQNPNYWWSAVTPEHRIPSVLNENELIPPQSPNPQYLNFL